jgi:hypothetical protein
MKRYLAGDLLPERREGFLEVLLLAGRLPQYVYTHTHTYIHTYIYIYIYI